MKQMTTEQFNTLMSGIFVGIALICEALKAPFQTVGAIIVACLWLFY